ncbi:MAG: hypothetical protein UZ06_CHB003001367, partial [Chlorobi bacterium OLB6]
MAVSDLAFGVTDCGFDAMAADGAEGVYRNSFR